MQERKDGNLQELFSQKIASCLVGIDWKELCEIRLRLGGRAVAATRTGRYFLSARGLTARRSEGIVCERQDLDEVMLRATNRSVYSVNENLRQGFVTYRGCRVGVCGEIVREGGRILTVKNITSLNIRIPHEAPAADSVLPFLRENGRLLHTLIFAPPACGKTTLVRDLAKKLSYADEPSHIVLIDERGEIGAFGLSECDLLANLPKAEGLHFAVRNLNPDVVICDEIKSLADVEGVFEAASCGVCVIATIHAATLEELRRKAYLSSFFSERVFGRYVRLSDRLGLGTTEEILDGEFRRIADAEVLHEMDRRAGGARFFDPARARDRGRVPPPKTVL